MQVIEMEKDGNCLFQCIAHALQIDNGPATLREMLASAIEDISIDTLLNIVLHVPDEEQTICDPEIAARLKSVDESQQKQLYRNCIRYENMFADELCIRYIADIFNMVHHHIILNVICEY